ncbi:hypothetical protein [Terriglobus saanensis]|uniref:Adenylate cyclase n=1 Tax=Terriglobus saanensis (strain ATCC BAA-1853 / DSM 23119 / SP1PR4) TaxID=401053 RepID=E8UXI3_TERSS|nr:hypothetical protein [Terriglobus saanensis]ADV81927.1 hypothetical protein AciPR4_1098 [Terriglobus saanensis SP1PR4]
MVHGIFTESAYTYGIPMLTAKQERSVHSPPPGQTTSATDWLESAHRELVNRIVISPTFARCERLSTLLSYICDMALKGRESDLNEQKIGQAVFGRSQDYDSSIDGIVRTQASRLRQRLDLYFEQEGAEEPTRVVIPKGGYIPVFMPRRLTDVTVEVQPPAPKAAEILPATPAHTPRSGSQIIPWLLCAAMACVLAIVLIQNHKKATEIPAASSIHPLWSQIFVPQQTTLEVPGDSGLVLSHVFDHRSISLNEYLLGDYRSTNSNSPANPLSLDMRSLRTEVTNRRYTSIVDLEAAVKLALIAQSLHSRLQVGYARDLRPNDLKSGNVILVGAFEANPWVELLERNMNFLLHNDYKAKVFSVINRSPHADEPSHWDSKLDDPQRRVYAVVAFTPNLSGNGNVLLIEGTSMAGTEAAWDFVSDDSELLPFLKRIQHPDGRIPHFELLLGTQNMSSSAVHSNLLAWRTSD